MKKITTSLAAALLAAFASAQSSNPWLTTFHDDASSGISYTKKYTHAVNFMSRGTPSWTTILGVDFYQIYGSDGSMLGFDGETYSWTGFPGLAYHTSDLIVTDPQNNEVYALLEEFAYTSDPSSTVTLSGLKPGAPYEICLYFSLHANQAAILDFQFDPFLATPPPKLRLDQTQGDPNGERLIGYRYNAAPDGTFVFTTQRVGGDRGFFVWAFSNELLSAPLAVEGAPPGMPKDAAFPPFGMHFDIAPGSNFTATVTAVWTNNAVPPTSFAHAIGWETLEDDGNFVYTNTTAFTAGTTISNYILPDAPAKIVWHFALTNWISVAAGPNGDVSYTGGWHGSEETVEIFATADTNFKFAWWAGDVPSGMASENPLFLPCNRPREVTAMFSGTQHVATNGSDSADGLSFATAKETIAGALAEFGPGGGLILVSNGVYTISSATILHTPVTVRGITGKPEDVTVRRNTSVNTHLFDINHPDARIESLAVRDGASWGAVGNILIGTLGGTVSNCVVSGGVNLNGNAWGPFAGGIYMDSPAALVTHCVITNNQADCIVNRHVGGVMMSRGGRLEHSLIADNRVPNGGGFEHWDNASAGGVYLWGGGNQTPCYVVNCTIAGNSGRAFGGVYAMHGALVNCVITGNESTVGGAFNPVIHAWGGTQSLFHNCYFDTAAPVNNTHPNFSVPPPPPMLSNIAAGDFTAAPDSPIIDAGMDVADVIPGYLQPAFDLAGNIRVQNEIIDVGCYEVEPGRFSILLECDNLEGFIPATAVFTVSGSGFNETDDVEFIWDFDNDGVPDLVLTNQWGASHEYHTGGSHTVRLTANIIGTPKTATATCAMKYVPRTLHVWNNNPLGTSAKPYDTWDNAATNLHDAVEYALDGCEIIIRAGEYPHASTLHIEKGVHIRPDPETPGEVVIQGATYGIRLVRIHHKDAWVEGVAIHGAYGQGGGNLYIDSNGGTVSNCVLRNASGIYENNFTAAQLSGANALLTHSVITNNTTTSDVRWGGIRSLAILRIDYGRVENCLISGNYHTTSGDITALTNDFAIVLMNNTRGVLRNCTIAGNKTSLRGIIHIPDGGDNNWCAVTNCVIAGNIPRDAGYDPAPIYSGIPGAVGRFFVCTTDNASLLSNGCNFGTPEAIFKNFAEGDYRLKTGSPAVNTGPRVGSDDVATAGVDLDGNPRIYGFRVDNGCYELQHAGGTLLIVR